MQQLTSLSLTLKPVVPLDRSKQSKNLGPYLQGALMEQVDTVYAAYLHQLPFNPYSQFCYWNAENLIWKVNALTNEAATQIVEPIRRLNSVFLKGIGTQFEVLKSSQETMGLKMLTDIVNEPSPTKVHIRFVTPTAFKSRGAYVMMPSVRLIAQNLLMHYGQVYDDNKEGYEETVDFIDRNVRILSYNLRSHYFDQAANGNNRIPAFIGSATLGLRGPDLSVGLVRMLLKFGEYAGVGIKTSMGMGGFVCD